MGFLQKQRRLSVAQEGEGGEMSGLERSAPSDDIKLIEEEEAKKMKAQPECHPIISFFLIAHWQNDAVCPLTFYLGWNIYDDWGTIVTSSGKIRTLSFLSLYIINVN